MDPVIHTPLVGKKVEMPDWYNSENLQKLFASAKKIKLSDEVTGYDPMSSSVKNNPVFIILSLFFLFLILQKDTDFKILGTIFLAIALIVYLKDRINKKKEAHNYKSKWWQAVTPFLEYKTRRNEQVVSNESRLISFSIYIKDIKQIVLEVTFLKREDELSVVSVYCLESMSYSEFASNLFSVAVEQVKA
jgi:hypothetical protein